MKKILILLLFFSLMGCNTIGKNKQTSEDFSCPRVFFSSEDRIFIDTSEGGTSIDELTYKAELNNFAFIDKCLQQNEAVIIPLDILIIAQPMEALKNGDVSIPLYAELLDQNDQVLETQYFMVSKSIKKRACWLSQSNNFQPLQTSSYFRQRMVAWKGCGSKHRNRFWKN